MSRHARSGGLSAVVVGLGLLTATGCVDRNPTLSVGDPLPLGELSLSHPSLVWVFDAEKCLGCTLGPSARVVRRLQHRIGDRVDVVVVALGDRVNENDDRLVRNFLRAERVSARVALWNRQVFFEEFGHGAPTSAVYVADQGRLVEIIEENEIGGAEDQLRALLERLLESPPC